MMSVRVSHRFDLVMELELVLGCIEIKAYNKTKAPFGWFTWATEVRDAMDECLGGKDD